MEEDGELQPATSRADSSGSAKAPTGQQAATELAAHPPTPAKAQPPRPQSLASHSREEVDWWVDQGGSSEGFSDEDEEALGMQTAPPEFYDPAADEKDEAWVATVRQGRRSDAILSCPACLTTVCLDCQQHAATDGQFRAMFVLNCRVNTDQTVKPRAAASGKRRRDRQDDSQPAETTLSDEAKFHPVLCGVCGQDMGVWDAVEQLYHFYHVVPTNA